MAASEFNRSPLPPYPEMIVTALGALQEPNGSNKTTISKYIESNYGELPAGHSQLLTHHLNRMKDTGELVFWKNNYMIRDPNAPPRRGRGRPPKVKGPVLPGAVSSPMKPRGRPPKDPDAPKPLKVSTGSGRPRGRPRKMAKPAGGLGGSVEAAAGTGGTGRPRGRPPKAKQSMTEVRVGN
ncbi:hypothetical protein MLD38_024399 [Melastoma candidum]|uniref:Uncharacterized protein n=1 Tax=Melastoma candidum TaxID=119954 RepID=A0ACB9NYX4_9MYRT|nr:hypothetical protein MLD38_024399 [Melastoma candidum]